MTIASWIRGRRAEKRESQVAASESIGVGVTTWARWEAGDEIVRLEHLFALARWGGVTGGELADLVEGAEDERGMV